MVKITDIWNEMIIKRIAPLASGVVAITPLTNKLPFGNDQLPNSKVINSRINWTRFRVDDKLLITLGLFHLLLDNEWFINCNFFWFFTLLQIVKEKNRAIYADFLIVTFKRSTTYISCKYQFKKRYFLNWYFAALRSALSEIAIADRAIYRYVK